VITFKQLAEHLAASAARVREELVRDLETIGEAQEKLAKGYIGHEQDAWPPLAESTIADKTRKGYPVPAPLLREGTMRDSIRHEVEPTAVGADLTVGSEEAIAKYQEMGTATIPPRPFLAKSAVEVLPVAEEKLGKTAVSLLTPGARLR
jgi:hypothetical protein